MIPVDFWTIFLKWLQTKIFLFHLSWYLLFRLTDNFHFIKSLLPNLWLFFLISSQSNLLGCFNRSNWFWTIPFGCWITLKTTIKIPRIVRLLYNIFWLELNSLALNCWKHFNISCFGHDDLVTSYRNRFDALIIIMITAITKIVLRNCIEFRFTSMFVCKMKRRLYKTTFWSWCPWIYWNRSFLVTTNC